MAPQKRIAFILPAGGARAVYQIGALRYIAENIPELKPDILCGVSAGSINAAFLAQGKPFELAIHEAYGLWGNLKFNDIFKTNLNSLMGMSGRFMNDLFFSKLTRRILFKSLFDATPLYRTLSKHINVAKIWKSIQAGSTLGISISTTNYIRENTTIFFDSHYPVAEWQHGSKNGVRTSIRLRHIMASCAIPLLFETVRIGDNIYGDGSLLFNSPFSPAIRMKATHILAIGTSFPFDARAPKPNKGRSTIGFVAGSLLNSVFLDAVETDYDNLNRLNTYADRVEEIRYLKAHLIQPSQDPGVIARNFIDRLPFTLRQLFRAGSMSPAELGGLLSYLLFEKDFLHELLTLGEADAKQHHHQLVAFLEDGKPRKLKKASS